MRAAPSERWAEKKKKSFLSFVTQAVIDVQRFGSQKWLPFNVTPILLCWLLYCGAEYAAAGLSEWRVFEEQMQTGSDSPRGWPSSGSAVPPLPSRNCHLGDLKSPPIDRTKSSNLIVKKADLTKLLSNWFKHESILHYVCLFSSLFQGSNSSKDRLRTVFHLRNCTDLARCGSHSCN